MQPIVTDSETPDGARITIREITDPVELAKLDAQQKRADRNWAWFQAHAPEIFKTCRGKTICISGEDLFVADTPAEVLELAKAAHPDDDGRIIHFVYKEKRDRIYGNLRTMVAG